MQGSATSGDVLDRSIRIERNSKTLRELTLDKMREAILGFHFQPGERLVERDLCTQLGVSRTIVREVLRHLESEGLVTTANSRGPAVAKTSPDEARQIYEIRMVLEAMAARACAAKPDAAVVSNLETMLDAIELAYREGSMSRVLSGTTEFYRILFESSGRLIALETVSSLTARINRLRSMTIETDGRCEDGPREMRAIVDAIRSGDEEGAAKAAQFHVERAACIAQSLLQTEADR